MTAKAGNGMMMEAIRPFLAACALAYFVIGKVGFEPRLALGSMSVNQALQIAVFVGLCCVPWYRGLGSIGRSRTLALAASLTLLLAIWAIDSANTAYAPSKVQGYAGLVLPSLVVLAGSLRGSQDVRRLLWLLAAVGTTMMLLGLLLLALGAAPPRLAILGGGANVYARMLGTALIVWGGFGYLGSKRWKISVWVLLGFAAALLFAGSKTVILGIGLSFVVLAWQIRSRRLAYGALVGTVLFVTLPLWTHAAVQHADKNRGEVRMLRMPDTSDPRGSYGTRLQYYRASLELLQHGSWKGVGTGDWAIAAHLPSGRRYPHNLLLEMACELGLAGLGLLALTLGMGVSWVRALVASNEDKRFSATLVALLFFWWFNAQLSGDVVDNRSIWLSMVLIEVVIRERRGGTFSALASPRISAAPVMTAPGLR